MLGIVIKTIHELWDWFRNKFKDKFSKEITDEQRIDTWTERFNTLDETLDHFDKRLDSIDENFQETKERLSFIEERQQEDTRSYLIDAHHKFCYEVKAIDDINLQSIERNYMYYKTAGGNSFIDGLVQEIRQLPRINTYNRGQC